MARKSDISSLGVKDPVTLICRHEQFYSETEFALHHHPFGQLLYVASGVMEMTVEGQRYLAPAGFVSGSRQERNMPVITKPAPLSKLLIFRRSGHRSYRRWPV